MNKTGQHSELFTGVPFDKVLNCVHCGLCLDDCPTYRELGTEQDSPRGRLYLMRAMWSGELEVSSEVMAPLDRCLDCRACETACPSHVPYGALLEKTRGVVASAGLAGGKGRWLGVFLLRRVLPTNGWLVFLSLLGRLWYGLGLARLLRSPSVKRFLPTWMVRCNELMPHFAGHSFKHSHDDVYPASGGTSLRRVGLFTGCVMDVADHEIHEASLKVLRAAGCQVVIPKQQVCCGALAVHAGEREIARQLALQNDRSFGEGLDAIVVNASGCGNQLKEYHTLFSDSTITDGPRWDAFETRIFDVLDFLAGLEGWQEQLSEEAEVVFYDAPCHLIHGQACEAKPRALLAGLPGLQLVPLQDADRCCGAAGIYNLVQGGLSEAILAPKLDDLEMMLAQFPQATSLVTANPGCLYQLRRGCLSRGLTLRVIHPVVLIAERLQG